MMIRWLAEAFERHRGAIQARLESRLRSEHATPVSPPSPFDWLRRGNAYLDGGDFEEAARCYELATRDAPTDAAPWVNLGYACRELERHEKAEPALRQATVLDPDNVDAWYLLGCVLAQRSDKLPDAEWAISRALELRPGFEPACVELCRIQFQGGRHEAARATALAGLAHAPEAADLHAYLGNIEFHHAEYEGALACFERALALQSDHAPAHLNYARALEALHRHERALAHYRQAGQLAGKQPDILLGVAGGLLQRGLVQESLVCLDQAVALTPNRADVRTLLADALIKSARHEDAIRHCRWALERDSQCAEAYLFMGIAHQELEQSELAIGCFDKALAIAPSLTAARSNLGSVHVLQGRLEEAIADYRAALEMNPTLRPAHDNLLFALNYHPELDAREIFAAYRSFEARTCAPTGSIATTHDNASPTGRKLRLGYVSPDIRHHAVMLFFEPVLAHHDPDRYEVFAYAEVAVEDAVTHRARQYIRHWRSTVGLSDEAVAMMIRDDRIDILIDLAGHTAGNRLHVFAHKPAPVSVAWLGYGYTTGLSVIDHYLGDVVSVPPGSEHLFAEVPWRLERCNLVFRPNPAMGLEGPSPVAKVGQVTFGTLTRAIRVNDRVVRAWAAILRRVPDSALVIDSRNYSQPSAQAALLARFAVHGVEASQLRVGYHSPPWDLLRAVDITLDCFPHNSGTTLFESLFMGIPFVTLAGRPSVGRLGASILHGLGHPEWIASSEEEYVDIAVRLARDPELLAALRARLRSEMRESTLMDEPGFTRMLERSYEAMFEAWHSAASMRTAS